MKKWMRGFGITLFLALSAISFPIVSQDDDTIKLTGSRIVTDVISALIEAGEIQATMNINATGTTTGFTEFCQGSADATGATRPMTVDEEALCTQNEVQFKEFLVGYDAVAVIADPDLGLTCLTINNLSTIFAPSAQAQITTWEQTELEGATGEVSVFVPADSTSTFVLMDNLIDGVGLRRDTTIETDVDALVEAVSSTSGAIGFVPLAVLGESSDVSLLQLDTGEPQGCFSPSVETIENRQYTVVDRLLLYVNAAETEEAGLAAILSALSDPATAEHIADAGYIAPSDNVFAQNEIVLAEDVTGRQFSQEVTAFEIPPSVVGTVNVGGASNLIGYIQNAVTSFTTQYPSVTVNVNIEGEPAGFRQLCNGEIDIMTASQLLPEEQVQNCQANNIDTHTIEVGQNAVVLVANSSNSYLTCLTTDQVTTIWGSPSANSVTTWNQVDESFPEEPMILVAPPLGTTHYTDLLLTPAEGVVVPLRSDVSESNSSALYRATAVNNVVNSLTYMSWLDYQNVIEEDPSLNIELVAVDKSSGCVTPSLESFEDGNYAYGRSNKLIVSRNALARSEVQSFLWYLLLDENFGLLEDAGIVGLDFGELPEYRRELQTAFSDAIAAATVTGLPPGVEPAEPPFAAEVTPEATAEVTEEPQ